MVAAIARPSNLAPEMAALVSITFEYKENMVASSVKTIEPTMAAASPPPSVHLRILRYKENAKFAKITTNLNTCARHARVHMHMITGCFTVIQVAIASFVISIQSMSKIRNNMQN